MATGSKRNPAIDYSALLWAAGGLALVGGVVYLASRRRTAASGSRQQLPRTYYTGTAATGGGTVLPPPAPTTSTPAPSTDPREAWYQDTLRRLRVQLDQLHAWAADDQYWRAVFWLNGQHVPGFRVPNNFPDNQMDRFDALRYVSDIVFAR